MQEMSDSTREAIEEYIIEFLVGYCMETGRPLPPDLENTCPHFAQAICDALPIVLQNTIISYYDAESD